VTRGVFITLEGGEGVGKSTQAFRLADVFRARGHDVILTREPGGTPGAEAIRDLLMNGEEDRWSPRTEALLFAAARADHVEKLIRPALEQGQTVICDRFVDSTRAYQGGADGMTDDDILEMHRVGCRGLLPDRTLVLSLPTATASERERIRDGVTTDRFGARDTSYRITVEANFRRLALKEPRRINVIRALGTQEDVTKLLLAALDDLL
jgi:dTMP kinase